MMLALHVRFLFPEQMVAFSAYGLSDVLTLTSVVSVVSVVLLFLGVQRISRAIDDGGLRTFARWILNGLRVALAMRGIGFVLSVVSRSDMIHIPYSVSRWINYLMVEHIVLFFYFVLIIGLGNQIRMVQFSFYSMRILRVIFMYFSWLGFELYLTAQAYLHEDLWLEVYANPVTIGAYLFIYLVLNLYTFMTLRSAKRFELASTAASFAV
jgi:hypothetical protein